MIPLVLKNDPERELKIFWYYINHKEDSYHRNLIFNYFVDLEDKLTVVNDDNHKKDVLKNCISAFRQSNSEKIKQIEDLVKTQIDTTGNVIIDELAQLMNYKFEQNHKGYIIVPVVLPFSPFKDSTFFYSVNKLLKSADLKSLDLLIVLAHEVSHFLLFDILKTRIINEEYAISDNELYFLKEILVVLLMRDANLAIKLKTDKYEGNMLLRYLYIKEKNNIKLIVDYFNDLYVEYASQDYSFDIFLMAMIKKIKSISTELMVKKEI